MLQPRRIKFQIPGDSHPLPRSLSDLAFSLVTPLLRHEHIYRR